MLKADLDNDDEATDDVGEQVILAIMHSQSPNILGAAKVQGKRLELLSNQHCPIDHLKQLVTSCKGYLELINKYHKSTNLNYFL